MCWVHDGETRGIGIRFTGARQQESPDGSWKFYIHTVVSHTHIQQCWSYKEARHGESPLKNWVHNGETPGIAFWFTGVRQQESPDCSWKVYINTHVPCILSKFYTYSVQMLHTHTQPHTHTPGRSRVNPGKARGKKKRTQTTGKWTEQRRGRGEQTDLRNQPTRRTDLNRTEHAQKPHNTLKRGRTNGGQKFCLVFGPKMQGRTLFPQRDRSRSIQKGHKQLSVLHGLCARRRNHT
jgi:hypothetical protein